MSTLPDTTEPGERVLPPPRPRSGVDEQAYELRKAAASRAQRYDTAASGPAPLNTAGRQTPGDTYGFVAQAENGPTPSDMALAVGDNFVVQVVNSSIAIYSKTGVMQKGYPKALSTFFPGTSGDLGDPRAFFDSTAGRFVVEADDFTKGVVHIAASTSGNPTKTWNLYSLAPWGAANCRNGGSACPDFPQVGYDGSTIYIGINFFQTSGAVSDWVLLLPKAAIYNGAGFSYNYWNNLTYGGVNVDTVQPITLVNKRENPRAGFGVNSFNINFGGGQCSSSACNGLVVWAFSNNLVASGSPGPEISGVGVGTANNYSLPAAASEPGCTNCIDTGDVRISGTPTYHAGVITASLNTNGSDGHSHVLWFQLHPVLNDGDARCTGNFANACAQITGVSITNEDCFFCGGQGNAGSSYYGTLTADNEGNLTMVYDFSDTATYPESAYTSRRVTQAANSMHDAGYVLCGGGGLYTQGRWGDYTSAVTDLTGAKDYMFFSAQNTLSNGNWGTCVGGNGFTSVLIP